MTPRIATDNGATTYPWTDKASDIQTSLSVGVRYKKRKYVLMII